jgi:HEAT repeat protein
MIWRRPIEIFFLLGALGACKPGANDMSEGLKNPDWHERERAVLALGGSPDHAGAVQALKAILMHDPDHRVRIDPTVALGQLGGPNATALLVEKAASTDESVVRTAALEAIETSRDPSAIPGLLNLFRLKRGLRGHDDVVGHDDDVVAQLGASQALLKIGAPGVPQLLEALSDSSPRVREAVVEVLGKVGNPEVADRITGLQADPDPAVRRAIAGALATLKANPAPTTP